MPTRKLSLQRSLAIALGLFFIAGFVFLFGQSKTPTPGSASTASVQEFPVNMRQNVAAGKTPVGTKVEAKLTMATLVSGKVIPAGAVFSGEVVASSARSAGDPSRLSIRMDSVQWKSGVKPLTVYLTAWYYPLEMAPDADREDCQPPGSMGAKCPIDPGLPGSRLPPSALPPAPSRIAETRVAMKDVESTRDADGNIALSSTHSNIKLDKSTTYVLATGELTAGKNDDKSTK